MTLCLVDIIAGARPNFIKIAPIISAIKEQQNLGGSIRYRLIHTGQHYDRRMSEDFFAQLRIPEPDINLNVGSGTQAEQTAAIMIRYEKLLLKKSSDLCLVVGDVTSSMACAITAQKLFIPVAHVEAGIRSEDWAMPEEINRMIIDSVTNYFFTTSETANENLRQTSVAENKIFFVGNTMIDTLLNNINRLRPPSFWDELKLEFKRYIVLTLHRPGNVDSIEIFKKMLYTIGEHTRSLPVIFPVHPRTAKTLSKIKGLHKNIYLVETQPYLEFNYLVKNAKAVITDSGGITEECTVMNVPCMTLRNSTERPETVTIGTNELIGTNPENLKPSLDKLFANKWKVGRIPEKWDGKSGKRIFTALEKLFSQSSPDD